MRSPARRPTNWAPSRVDAPSTAAAGSRPRSVIRNRVAHALPNSSTPKPAIPITTAGTSTATAARRGRARAAGAGGADASDGAGDFSAAPRADAESAGASARNRRRTPSSTATHTAPLSPRCRAAGPPTVMTAAPSPAPAAAPRLQPACMVVSTGRASRVCTCRPCAFWAVSTTASSTPDARTRPAKTHSGQAAAVPAPCPAPAGAPATSRTRPAAVVSRAMATLPASMTRRAPNRRRIGAGRGPASVPPTASAMTSRPNPAGSRPNAAFASG